MSSKDEKEKDPPGRKPIVEGAETTALRIHPDDRDKFRELSHQYRLSNAELFRYLVEVGEKALAKKKRGT